MASESRRRFLAVLGAGAGAAFGSRALRGQSPRVSVPGPEAGRPTALVALRNVTVIDGTGMPARAGMTVVVMGNRIRAVTATPDAALGADVESVNATGKFLIPGLWDMHTHPLLYASFLGGVDARTVAERLDISPLFIPNGVVGVRTMGGQPFLRRPWRLGAKRLRMANGWGPD